MKELKIAFIIIGSIIGAGFASGKEIYEYFAKFGAISLLFIIPLFIFFFIFTKVYLNLGAISKNEKVSLLNSTLCKPIKIFNKSISYLNIFMFTTFLILSSCMFSGLVALIQTYFSGISEFACYIIVLALSALLLKVSFKTFETFLIYIVPLIIICIAICAIFSFNGSFMPFTANFQSLVSLPALTLAYASQNTFLASVAIIKSGKNLTKKEQTKVSLIVSTVLCSLLTLGIFCFLLNPNLGEYEMPFAEISKALNPTFSIVFGLIILFSILTTYSTSITSLKEYFSGNKKYNKPYIMLGLIVLLSLFNFGTIVEYLYPLIGIFGVVYCYKCLTHIGYNKCLNRHKPSCLFKNENGK